MNVVIQINVRDAIRDAIPVRAIPFLTSWQKFSPDVLAAVLAQFDWWSNFVYRELCALSDAIRARQETQETGYQEWREQSIRILPAGVFVWRDEFEAGYARTLDKWQRVAGAVLDSLVLNLRPDIPPKYTTSLILEGFNTQEPDSTPAPERKTQTLAPVPDRVATPQESAQERQARRHKMCIDAGLDMPTHDYGLMPRGIGKLAKIEKITRQSFTEDVKAHIRRLSIQCR